MEEIMSKTNDTERTRELEADRDELLQSELNTVTGGSPIGGPAIAFNSGGRYNP